MGQSCAHMHLFGDSVSGGSGFFLILAVALALGFECVNGFHDTANAVATVIYTHALKPWIAVVWSGMWNLIGVLLSSGAVAYGVVALLPVELVLNVGSAAGFAMVFALLISAIIWNAGHLVHGPAGQLVALADRGDRRRWPGELPDEAPGHKSSATASTGARCSETFTALLVSPVVGFVCAGGDVPLAQGVLVSKQPELYAGPGGREAAAALGTPGSWC